MTRLFTLVSAAAMALALAGTAQAETLTVYSAGPGGMINKLAADFQKMTGATVNVFQATTGKVMARLEAEQANPVADVVISASWDTATDYDAQGLLLDYMSPNAEKVPDFLKAPTYVAQGISALAIAWNTKSGTPEPAGSGMVTRSLYSGLARSDQSVGPGVPALVFQAMAGAAMP